MNSNQNKYDLTQRGRCHLAKLAFLVVIIALSALLPGLGQQASATTLPPRQPCQVVLVPASTWLGGRGFDACKNTWGNDYSHSSGYGTEWQCVELAQAVYAKNLWYGSAIFANVSKAYQIFDNAASLGFIRHANGDGIPVPGDMIIHGPANGFLNGHVSVVDYVANGKVNVVEQNASATGRATYTLSGSMLSRPGFSLPIKGYVHAPANQITQPPTTFTAASDPVAVNGGPNGIDLFVTGVDGNLYHRWWNGGVWAGWESLRQPAGVSLVGDVSVIVNHPNPIDLFARGSNGGLYHRYYQAGAWQPWQQLVSSGLAADPVAGSGSGFDTLDVFYPDTGSGTVWDTYYTASNNTWTTSAVPNGNSVQRKVAVREASGVIELTVRGGGGEVYSVWFTGSWSGWADRHGQTNGDPTTATTSTGEIDLFVPGEDNNPYVCNDGVGCGWKGMCGATISGSDVAAVTTGPDTQDDFYRNAGGSLSYCGNLGYGYDMGGGLVGTPSAIGGSPDELDVFVHGLDNTVWWKSFTSSGWSGWNQIDNKISGTQ